MGKREGGEWRKAGRVEGDSEGVRETGKNGVVEEGRTYTYKSLSLILLWSRA